MCLGCMRFRAPHTALKQENYHNWIECYALIDTYEGSDPCLDKIARVLGGPISDDGRSIPIECVVGHQAM